MATWESKQLSDTGTLQQLADVGENAITSITAFLTIASTAADTAKTFLNTVANPAATAAAALADAIIASLNNYKESGYYALVVNPMDDRYGKKKFNSKGFEMRRDSTGAVIFQTSTVSKGRPDVIGTKSTPNDSYRLSLKLPDLDGSYMDANGRTKGDGSFIPPVPELAFPLKLVDGGYDPTTWTGTQEDIVEIPTFDAATCRTIMADAFDDKGDIPKFKLIDPSLTTFDKGSLTPFTVTGEAISTADLVEARKGALLKFDLYNSGNTALSRTDRDKLTTQVSSGRPNYQGDTELTGQTISGLAFIVAAEDPTEFLNSILALQKLLPSMPDFTELIDRFKAIFEPENVQVTISVDTNYGQFAVGDVIRGQNSDGLGEVVSIDSTANSVIEIYTQEYSYDDFGDLNGINTTEVNGNPNGRWKDTTLTYKPLGDALERTSKLNPGEPVYEQQPYTKTNSDGTTITLYKDKGSEFKNTTPRNPLVSPSLLPKYGKVIGLEALAPESIEPDFFSIQAKELIPGWSEFFDGLIQLANGIKGIAEDTSAFIQALIDTIDDLLERFTKLANALTQLIELLTAGLPDAGIFYLGMTTSDGNEGFKSGLLNSENAPGSNYKYSAGIMLIGDPAVKKLTGRDPIEVLFGDVLGVEFQSV